MAGGSIVGLSRVVLLWWLELMLQGVLQGNKNRLSVGEHDSMAGLSGLLLEGGHSGVAVAPRLSSVSRPAGYYACALSVDFSGSWGALRVTQRSEGDLFSHTAGTLVRGGQAPHHLLHLQVVKKKQL